MNAATRRATELGVQRLNLHSESARVFYAGLGWRKLGDELYHELPVVLMERDLASQGGAALAKGAA